MENTKEKIMLNDELLSAANGGTAPEFRAMIEKILTEYQHLSRRKFTLQEICTLFQSLDNELTAKLNNKMLEQHEYNICRTYLVGVNSEIFKQLFQ